MGSSYVKRTGNYDHVLSAETKSNTHQAQMERVKAILSQNRCRVTRSRLAVASTLIAKEELFLTPEEIQQDVLEQDRVSCDLTSVYRTISLLLELELVTKSEFYGEATRYGWRGTRQSARIAHTHYFMCNRCHKVKPLSDCGFPPIASMLEKLGYTDLSHRFEVRGTCPDCR
jgi:Fe2+ or Zn2+ uptake regulation protein